MQQHFLQTEAWAEFQKSQKHEVFYVEKENYQYLAILDKTPLGNYLFLPYGPSIRAKKYLKNAISDLKRLASSKNAFFIRIEPLLPLSATEIKNLNLIKTKDIEPKFTQIIDLTVSEDEIKQNFQKEKFRHWRNKEKNNLSVKSTKNPEKIDILYNFYAATAKNNNFAPHDKKYLADQLKHDFATLYYVEYDKKPIAASIVYDDKNTRYYAHAAADYEHRKLYANTILVIQMILDAKKSGKKSFDLWGITPSNDPNDPWYGFTRFKKSFGGTQVEFAGTFDLPLNRQKYQLYKILRKINRAKRKILKNH